MLPYICLCEGGSKINCAGNVSYAVGLLCRKVWTGLQLILEAGPRVSFVVSSERLLRNAHVHSGHQCDGDAVVYFKKQSPYSVRLQGGGAALTL